MARKKKDIVLQSILIESYAAEGKSIARIDGKVVFVERVVPGDVVNVRITKSKKDWAEGFPLEFISYSKERTEPFCSHFGICGGCQWQMLPYAKQLEYKQKQVTDNLQRIAKVKLPPIAPIIGAAETKYYRNKLEYTFATEEFTPEKPRASLNSSEGGALLAHNSQLFKASNNISGYLKGEDLSVGQTPPSGVRGHGFAGFHARGFWSKVVDIEKCYLQAEPTNEVRLAIKNFALQKGYSFYNLREQKGFLRTIQVRLCETGEWMANIMFGEDDMEKVKSVLDYVLEKFSNITSLLYTINTKRNDSLHGLEPIAYYGKGYVVEKLEDYQFKIGPKSFFQTNTKQGTKLYEVARDFAELTGKEILYDLYCGTGSIGIFCSKNATKVIGVEVVEEAIADAKENAQLNGIDTTYFYAGDVIDICDDDFFAKHGRPNVIITDPPRAGMHEKLVKKINEIAAPIVVYVSCNPATQARDLALLDEKYEVTKVLPVDMFPHTLHIENVVQLKLRKF
ncbi:MAG: 23S rRNA (uracil(1939)-C(5))-methyltransferase RlmD [Niabella sp.]